MSGSDDFASTSSSRWISSSGEIAHPNSPRGGGGPGGFRSPGPLGTEHNPVDLPHPESPTGRMLLANDAERILRANAKPANVKLNITVNKPKVATFRVGGRTLADAKKALDARDEWGLYDAKRNLKSSARVDAKGNVVSVTMVLNPVIELPAWSGYSSATKEQKASWDAMYNALMAHENHHHDLQLECVEELKNKLKAATTLDADTLNQIIEKLRKSCQDKQDAYDSRSGHGAKEGVVLKLDA
jgi:predicted secreted Zn-dependent protease